MEAIKWIKVEDRLPEPFVSVLGAIENAGDMPPVRECYLTNNGVLFPAERGFYFPALKEFCKITHWMPMPELPKGGEADA